MVSTSYNQSRIIGKWPVFWQPIHVTNWWKSQHIQYFCVLRSMINYTRNGRSCRNVQIFIFHNFYWKYMQYTCIFYNFWQLNQKNDICTFFNNLKLTRISWNNYWWAVWHRLIGVVMKWSSSLYSGIEVEMKLSTYFHLLLRQGMSGVVPILPNMLSWHVWGQLYLEQFIIEKISTWIVHKIAKKMYSAIN